MTIEYFDSSFTEEWKVIKTSLKKLFKGGSMRRTYLDSFDKVYLMVEDHLGHVEWYRMDGQEYYKQIKGVKNGHKKWTEEQSRGRSA